MNVIPVEDLDEGMEIVDSSGNIVVVDEVRAVNNASHYRVTLTDGRTFVLHYSHKLRLADEE